MTGLELDALSLIVLESEDVNELRKIEYQLVQEKSILFQSLEKEDNLKIQIEIKGRLSKCTYFLDTIKMRILEIKDNHNRANYNFRMTAKKFLSAKMYNRIHSFSTMPRSQFKELFKDMDIDKPLEVLKEVIENDTNADIQRDIYLKAKKIIEDFYGN